MKHILKSLMLLIGLLCVLPLGAQDADKGYQEALRRIEEVRASKATLLNLTHLFLTELPPELFQLNELVILDLSSNNLTELPAEIGQLTGLQALYLIDNHLESLPPEIGQLKNLQTLTLIDNPLTTLPLEIGHLPSLWEFSASYLTFPPPEIWQQGHAAMFVYLRDYEAMLMHQTIAGIAGGVGGIALLILAFRWRQRRGLGEKKKRL